MWTWVAVALGGAVGALARFGVARLFLAWGWTGFPWATLAVNGLGAGLLTSLSVVLTHRGAAPSVQFGLTAGLLGAFTTYSTFNLELLFLFAEGRRWIALLYGVVTVLGALACGALGMVVGRLAVGQNPFD